MSGLAGGRTASRPIDRAFVRDERGPRAAFLLCEQNPRPGFVHCTCAVPRRWRRGGGWRLARAAPTPHGDRGVARGPGRRHVPLPCVVAGLLQRPGRPTRHTRSTHHSPTRHATRPGGFSPGGDGSGRKDGCAPRRPEPGSLPPRRRRVPCGHAWPMATVRSQAGQPDRRRSWHDIGGDVHAAYRHESDFCVELLGEWVVLGRPSCT